MARIASQHIEPYRAPIESLAEFIPDSRLIADPLRLLTWAPTCVTGYSTSRTCEIGLSEYAGFPYESMVYLVDACARSTVDHNLEESPT